MPPPFIRHLFVCGNERPPDSPRGDCASKGAGRILDRLKAQVIERGLKGKVRAQKAACLDACECGVSIVVYPEAVWYGGVTLEDVDEIVESHLVGGRPVERLRRRFDELAAAAGRPGYGPVTGTGG